MKSDAPKGDEPDNDKDLEPSEEDDSEYDPNFDPLAQNRWAEPHGPAGIAGHQNGYADHVARQRQLEAEIDRQIEAQLAQEELDDMPPYMNNARSKYGEPMGLPPGMYPGMTAGMVPGMTGGPMGGAGGGMGTMPSTMDARARYAEQELPIELQGIEFKENGEPDIDKMNEAQLLAHMLRLQQALVAHGGNPDDLGDSSDYSESVHGGNPQSIQKNKGGVVLGSSVPDPLQIHQQKQAAAMQQNEIQKMAQIQKNNANRQRQRNQQQQQQQQQDSVSDDQAGEQPETQRQLQHRKAMQAMNGNFSIPLPKNPDEELGFKFDTFTVSLSVMIVFYFAAIGILIYFVMHTVDGSGDYGVSQRNIPGSTFGFIHQECRGKGASMQPYTWQSQLNLIKTDITEVKFGPCNHVYARKGNDKLTNPWYVWNEGVKSWKQLPASPQNAQRIDPQGNLWFFDDSDFGLYNITSNSMQTIEIKQSEMIQGEDLTSLNHLTFRDGYIYVLCNVGLYVWKGDLESGYFSQVQDDSTYKYIQSASPSQIHDFVGFNKIGESFESSLINIDKNDKELIKSIGFLQFEGVDRPVFSNDLDQTFLQTKDKLYQIMTNSKDRVETITYSLPDGPFEAPAVNINGDVYYKEGNQWKKKTFRFQNERSFIEIQTTNLAKAVSSQDKEKPERKNLYIIGIIILIFLMGGAIGFLYSKYRESRDGPKVVDPKDEPCAQNVGVANMDDEYGMN